jgi:hypothetical protein
MPGAKRPQSFSQHFSTQALGRSDLIKMVWGTVIKGGFNFPNYQDYKKFYLRGYLKANNTLKFGKFLWCNLVKTGKFITISSNDGKNLFSKVSG